MTQQWQIFWNDFARESYDQVGLLPENKRMLFHIAQLVGSDQLVLDAGCGSGNLCLLLAKQNRVIGLDFSEEMLSIAKKKTQHLDISFKSGDITDLPFESGTFDVVVSVNVIFNINNPDKVISEAYRVLRSNGRFIVCCPAAHAQLNQSLKNRILDDSQKHNLDREKTLQLLDKNRQLFESGGMKYIPTKDALTELLEEHGFTIKRSEEIYYDMNHLFEAFKA